MEASSSAPLDLVEQVEVLLTWHFFVVVWKKSWKIEMTFLKIEGTFSFFFSTYTCCCLKNGVKKEDGNKKKIGQAEVKSYILQ